MVDMEEVELGSVSDSSSVEDDREALFPRRIGINREGLNEVRFEAGYSRVPKSTALRERLKSALPPEPIRSALTPPLTRGAWLEFLLIHVPIIRWVWTYQLKFIINDVISGVTVAIMHIPQGLAYALLADLPPVYGLYASFIPPIIYSLLGSSRHISVGTFAVVQLMIGNSIEKVFASDQVLQSCLEHKWCENTTDGSAISDGSAYPYGDVDCVTENYCSSQKASIAITIAMVSGVIMLVMGLLQLGFISIFLSESLVSGYTTGAACHVFTSQLTHILGIKNKVSPGLFQIPRTWIKSFSILPKTNIATLIISLISMAALIGFRFLNKWLKTVTIPLPSYQQRKWSIRRVKWTIPIPAPLVVLITATLISFLASFEDNFSIIIVGDIPQGAPSISNPFTSYISISLIIDSFVIAIVAYSVSVSLARKFAIEHDYPIHSNQEFIAYGAMNIIGSFFSSFTAAGSLSRSLIQSNGGKTQLVGFVSSGIILVVLLWLGALFEPLPRAVLAATIWVALWGMFSQVAHVWNFFKLSFSDFLIWVVVFVSTVLLGVDLGLVVGVVFSLLVIVYRTALPYSAVLGQAKNTEIFRNSKHFQVDTIDGVLIFRFMAPICFVNAAVFRTRLEMECDLHKKQAPGGEEKGFLEKMLPPPEQWCRRRGSYDVTKVQTEGEGDGDIALQRGVNDDVISDRDLRVAPKKRRKQLIRSVVIDCAPISFLDAVGVKALKQLVLDFDKCNVQVLFAAMTQENRDMLDRAKFYKVCGKEWLFPSIQDAVHHARFGDTLHPVVDEGIAPVERETELVDNGGSQIHEELDDTQQNRQEDHLEDQQNHQQEEPTVATSFMEPIDS